LIEAFQSFYEDNLQRVRSYVPSLEALNEESKRVHGLTQAQMLAHCANGKKAPMGGEDQATNAYVVISIIGACCDDAVMKECTASSTIDKTSASIEPKMSVADRSMRQLKIEERAHLLDSV